jgi:hypothetical protein
MLVTRAAVYAVVDGVVVVVVVAAVLRSDFGTNFRMIGITKITATATAAIVNAKVAMLDLVKILCIGGEG